MNNKNLSLMLFVGMLISNINVSAITFDEAKATGKKYAKEIAGTAAVLAVATIGAIAYKVSGKSVKPTQVSHTVEGLFGKDDKKSFKILAADALKGKKLQMFVGEGAKFVISLDGHNSEKGLLKLSSADKKVATVFYLNLKSRTIVKLEGDKENNNFGTKENPVYYLVNEQHDANKLAKINQDEKDSALNVANAWSGIKNIAGKAKKGLWTDRNGYSRTAIVAFGGAAAYALADASINCQGLNLLFGTKEVPAVSAVPEVPAVGTTPAVPAVLARDAVPATGLLASYHGTGWFFNCDK